MHEATLWKVGGVETGFGRGKNRGWWGGNPDQGERSEREHVRVHAEGTAQEKHFPKTTEGRKQEGLIIARF